MIDMTNASEADLVRLGYQVVLFGDLARIRQKVRMSRNAQALLIGVEGESLRLWEDMRRAMNIETALRVGEWYWGAKSTLESIEGTIDIDQLVPISKAAQYLGTAQHEIEHAVNKGHLKSEKLGVLGTFVYRSEITVSVGD